MSNVPGAYRNPYGLMGQTPGVLFGATGQAPIGGQGLYQGAPGQPPPAAAPPAAQPPAASPPVGLSSVAGAPQYAYQPPATGANPGAGGPNPSVQVTGGVASGLDPNHPGFRDPMAIHQGVDPNGVPFFQPATAPVYGQYGNNVNSGQLEQEAGQKWSLPQDVNYGDYQRFGSISQGYGAAGQQVLNDPRAAQALQMQGAQARGPSAGQSYATGQQGNALDLLGNAAAGRGPTAADIQSQKSISDAMHAQLTAAASARGGAYAQAAAQQQAGQNAAGIQATGAANAAQLRAQEMQAAQGEYAGAAGQAVSGANQAYLAQQQALQGYAGSAAQQQGLAQNYFSQQQQAYQHQSDMAAQLAQSQIANDYGLSGTQLQTQTQQNIANQQQQQQLEGAGIAAGGAVLAAMLSTGGAEAAAKGAREHGADERTAAQIGAHVGQAIGHARAGSLATHFQMQDRAAAQKGAMTPAEMHAHLAKLRAKGRPAPKPTPGPETEPEAAHAYAMGSHMAMLAKMHAAKGAPAHGAK